MLHLLAALSLLLSAPRAARAASASAAEKGVARADSASTELKSVSSVHISADGEAGADADGEGVAGSADAGASVAGFPEPTDRQVELSRSVGWSRPRSDLGRT